MKFTRTAIVIACVIAAGGATGGVAVAMSNNASEDYVRPDGTVDPNLIPDTMTMVDANGDIVVDEQGNPILLDAHKLLDATGPDPFQGRHAPGKMKQIVAPDGSRIEVQEAVPIPQAELIKEYGINQG